MQRWRTALTLFATLVLITATFGCGGLARKKPDSPAGGRGDDAVAKPASRGWTLGTVRDAKKRGAVCNNGGAATYFFDEGEGGHRDDFVLFLKGGGGCGTVEECQEREAQQPGLMRPSGTARAPHGMGLMSDDPAENPDFHDWTKVWIPYCSSDSWMGDQGAKPENGNYHFRGSRIITAVVEDLRDEGLPGTDIRLDDGRLLFAGGSAGANGMRMNIDRVAALLPDAAWVKGVGDGFIVPPRAAPPSVAEDLRIRYSEMQGLRPDDSCVAAHPEEPWVCTEVANIREFVDTPIFSYMDVLDGNLLGREGLKRGTPEARDFAEAIREQLVELGPGVFASAKGNHVILITDQFHDLEVRDSGRDLTYAEVLGNWVFDRSGPKVAIPSRDEAPDDRGRRRRRGRR